MKKTLVFLVAAAAVVMTAGPAWAHEEISPPTVQTGKPTFLSLSAANEKKAALTKVTLRAPNGTPFGEATRQPAGWTAQRSEDTITWSGGSVAPESFEQWGFEIEGADQPGALTFRVTMGFADNSTENADVVVTAVAAGSTEPTVTTGAGTGKTAVTSRTSEPASGTTAPETATGTDEDADSNGLAVAAIVVGGLALLLAGVALAQARRGGTAATAAPPTGGSERDW
jgi:uncharacterized protein YcnI